MNSHGGDGGHRNYVPTYPPISRSHSNHSYTSQAPVTNLSPTSHYSTSSAYSSGPTYPQHSAGPQPTTGSGYLDSFSSMPGLPDVMEMEMDPALAMDLSILSAQEHRDLRVLQQHQRALSDEGSEHASASEPDTPRRGSTRKQRGRPRLDTKDENAADRRRTQIRLAQRAYRLRKETTISSLRTRVTELENGIDAMQRTFLQLHDSLPKESYSHSHAELKETFQNIVRTALGPSDAGSSGEGEDDEQDSRLHHSRPRSRDDDEGSGHGDNNLNNTSTSQPASSHSWGYNINYNRASSAPYPDSTSSNSNSNSNSNPQTRPTSTNYPYSTPLYSSPSPYHSPTTTPPSPADYTYTLSPTTFSRHLHRASLQRSLNLLTSPPSPATDAIIARTFAYTFCYISRQGIIATMTSLLSSPDSQSLYLSDRPDLISRTQQEGFEDDLAAYQDSGNQRGSPEVRGEAHKQLARLGVGQKYLRPDDVENLLIEGGWITVSGEGLDVGHGERYASTDSGIDNSELIFPKPHSRPATEEEFIQHGKGTGRVVVGVRKGLRLEVFVKELIDRGVCLGQFPAFRRGDVDAAIKVATIEGSPVMGGQGMIPVF